MTFVIRVVGVLFFLTGVALNQWDRGQSQTPSDHRVHGTAFQSMSSAGQAYELVAFDDVRLPCSPDLSKLHGFRARS